MRRGLVLGFVAGAAIGATIGLVVGLLVFGGPSAVAGTTIGGAVAGFLIGGYWGGLSRLEPDTPGDEVPTRERPLRDGGPAVIEERDLDREERDINR